MEGSVVLHLTAGEGGRSDAAALKWASLHQTRQNNPHHLLLPTNPQRGEASPHPTQKKPLRVHVCPENALAISTIPPENTAKHCLMKC